MSLSRPVFVDMREFLCYKARYGAARKPEGAGESHVIEVEVRLHRCWVSPRTPSPERTWAK